MQCHLSAKFTYHKGSVYALAGGSTPASFLSSGSDGVVVQCNLLDPARPVVLAKVNGQVFSLLWLPENNHLLIGTMSGALHVVDPQQQREIHCITYHEQSVFDIKWFRGQVLVASKDGILSVWDSRDYTLQRSMQISSMSLRMIGVNEERAELAVACSDNQVYLVNGEDWCVKAVLQGPENSVFSVAYQPGTSRLLAGSRDAQLYVYDAAAHQLESKVKAHLYTINHIVCIPEKDLLATASRDKNIRLWNADNLELIKTLDHEKNNGHLNSVNRLLWLPSQQALISASDDRTVIAWNIE